MKNRQRKDPIATAMSACTVLTASEIEMLTKPIHEAQEAMRKGMGTERHFESLCSALHVSKGFDKSSGFKVLTDYANPAEAALMGIARRASESGAWKSVTLYADELDAISLLVSVHVAQLKQVTYGEYVAAVNFVIAKIRSTGGDVTVV